MRWLRFVLISVVLNSGWLSTTVLADFDAGVMAYSSGDFETAAREFSLLADKGDQEGQYHLGLLYEEGQGVTKSFTNAVNCYTNAAKQGYLDAYFALGEIYLRQPDGRRDRVHAYFWLSKAAKSGHPRGNDEFMRNMKLMTTEQISQAESLLSEDF